MNTGDVMTALRPRGEVSFEGAVKRVFVIGQDAVIVQYWCERGDDGVEIGVRVEVDGASVEECSSEYEAPEIHIDRPSWRADLFCNLDGEDGNWDAAHFHPRFRQKMPGSRVFEPALQDDPVGWLRATLKAPRFEGGTGGAAVEVPPALVGMDAGAADHIAGEVESMLAVLDQVIEQFQAESGIRARPALRTQSPTMRSS